MHKIQFLGKRNIPAEQRQRPLARAMDIGDPLVDRRGAAPLRASLLGVYRPMESDPAFHELGSATTYAHSDQDNGHYYEYIPASAPHEHPPMVIFVHGSAENFKGYLYVWQAIADAGKFVVVAPNFGFGNWQRPGAVQAIERARMHALRDLGADPGRIYLAGLSNGGRGVPGPLLHKGAASASGQRSCCYRR